MKNRWIGGLALATALTTALTLGACAPQQGADESDEALQGAETSAPTVTAEPSDSPEAVESTEASESAAPTPYDY